MYVVAGLPTATAVDAERSINSFYRKPCHVIQLASSLDNSIYRREYLRNLITTVAEFTKTRRAGTSNRPVTPAFIYLLYVPAPDRESLLKYFDFTVFPIPLLNLASRNVTGQMLRHDAEAVANAIQYAIQGTNNAHDVLERIKLARPKDAILLPPVNFHVDRTRRLACLFEELRKGTRPWNDRFNELSPKQFNRESLRSIKNEKTQYCFQDSREVVFFQPHETAYHGGQWEVDKVDADTAIHTLRALYRFGAPLHQGFQHDAQLQGGEYFKNQVFDCAQQGQVLVDGDHANIYPNDFVRAKDLKRK